MRMSEQRLGLQFANPLLKWLPDETMFSLCSRHHQFWGYAASSQSTELLFGRHRAGTQHDFPNSLDAFTSRTCGVFGDPASIAREHTLLRYYRPFLHRENVDQAARTMRGGSVAHLKFHLGLLTSRFRANHPLKICPSCMQRDMKAHGWVYWHLQHQLPGVWTCPSHDESLLTSNLKSTGVERFLWHLPTRENLSSELDGASDASIRAMHRLSRMVVSLVEHNADDGWLTPDLVQQTLRTRLAEKGWITASGNIRLNILAADYAHYCSPIRTVAELASLPSDTEEAKPQIGRLLRPMRSGTHPLRLLLAIDWLFEDATDFIDHHHDLQPDPENLDTPADEGSPSIDVAKLAARARLVELLEAGQSATSTANELGIDVVTAMTWAAAAGISVARRPKLLVPLVRASLIKDLKRGLNKIDAAGRHGISIESVTRLLHTEVGLHAAWTTARAIKAQEASRKAWLKVFNAYGHLGVKIMRGMTPAVYAWLYRNDRAWLFEHTPNERVTPPGRPASSVRWDVRDQDLSLAVKRAALALVQQPGKKAMQLWQIYQAVPALKPKLRVLHQLPLTRQAIEQAMGRNLKRPKDADLFD